MSTAIQTKENKPTPDKATGTPQPINKQRREQYHKDPPVDLQQLPEEQQEAVRRVLKEEFQAFAINSDMVGRIPCFTFHDMSPVQKTYMFIAKPLQSEFKLYLQDLLNKRVDQTITIPLFNTYGMWLQERRQLLPLL